MNIESITASVSCIVSVGWICSAATMYMFKRCKAMTNEGGKQAV